MYAFILNHRTYAWGGAGEVNTATGSTALQLRSANVHVLCKRAGALVCMFCGKNVFLFSVYVLKPDDDCVKIHVFVFIMTMIYISFRFKMR